jgi:hypothetical protein
MLSKTGEIRRDEACLDYAGQDVILYPCHGGKGNQVGFQIDFFCRQYFRVYLSNFSSGPTESVRYNCITDHQIDV